MILLQDPLFGDRDACPYLPEEISRNYFFHARWVDADELEQLLSTGWRRFATYYFRPYCPACVACQPIRILTTQFKPSKSQRRLLRKNDEITCVFTPKIFTPEIFELYTKHSMDRFQKPISKEEFLDIHYTDSCPAIQSEYYLDDKLVAVGFLDQSENGLSSSYFFYDTFLMSLGLGIYSILKEIEYTKSIGLDYYYLGYFIKNNHHMNYKNRFYPHEIFDWDERKWNVIQKT